MKRMTIYTTEDIYILSQLKESLPFQTPPQALSHTHLSPRPQHPLPVRVGTSPASKSVPPQGTGKIFTGKRLSFMGVRNLPKKLCNCNCTVLSCIYYV